MPFWCTLRRITFVMFQLSTKTLWLHGRKVIKKCNYVVVSHRLRSNSSVKIYFKTIRAISNCFFGQHIASVWKTFIIKSASLLRDRIFLHFAEYLNPAALGLRRLGTRGWINTRKTTMNRLLSKRKLQWRTRINTSRGQQEGDFEILIDVPEETQEITQRNVIVSILGHDSWC